MPYKYFLAWATRWPWNCCWLLSIKDTNKVLILMCALGSQPNISTRHVEMWRTRCRYSKLVCVCAGLLGAAPAMPLLTNPALSAALLQLLLQNQVQQVLNNAEYFCPFFLSLFIYLNLLPLVICCSFFLLLLLVSLVLTLPFFLASLPRKCSSLGAGSAQYRKPSTPLCEWCSVSLWCGVLGRDRDTARPDSYRMVYWISSRLNR